MVSTGYCLEPLKPFDWNTAIEMPPVNDKSHGSQILHFKTADKPYTLSKEATTFVEENFKNAQELNSDADTLRYASDQVTLDGLYIELGVCPGKTINFLAALNPHITVYGFDTFTGSPQEWVRQDKTFKKGTYKFRDSAFVPPTLQNVVLFKGLFKKTLPEFTKQYLKKQPIALLHIDSDTYASAKDGFDALGKNIVPGTIIVFDEFYNFPGAETHEYKALQEFLMTSNYAVEYIAFNALHQQTVVRIKAK